MLSLDWELMPVKRHCQMERGTYLIFQNMWIVILFPLSKVINVSTVFETVPPWNAKSLGQQLLEGSNLTQRERNIRNMWPLNVLSHTFVFWVLDLLQ